MILTEAEVRRVERLTPTFLRVELGADALADFGVDGPLYDQRIKLLLPLPGRGLTDCPRGADWYAEWRAQPEERRNPLRTYTVRAVRQDLNEVDVDIVLHGDTGPAARWANGAKPGSPLVIMGPNALYDGASHGGLEFTPPAQSHALLLAGDETAVPAIGAILESLPDYMTGHAFLEVPEAGDFLDLETAADVEITWLARGASIGRSRPHGELLQEAVLSAVPVPGWVGIRSAGAAGPEPDDVNVDQEILWETPARLDAAAVSATKNPDKPAGALPFYAWMAGEAGVIKEMRRYLVRDVGIDRKQVAFMGYWRQGKAEL
jgi:NADPH-dependent ferric siderophore reductase